MPEEFKHIVRIAGKDLKGDRRVELALADLKGVSIASARAVAYAANVDPFGKLGNLNDEQVKHIAQILNSPSKYGIPTWMLNRRKDPETGKDIHFVGTDVTTVERMDISRERQIRSRRGIRHELGLPVRGQRTRTTGRKGLVVGVKRKDIRIREEAAKAAKGKIEKPAEKQAGKAPVEKKPQEKPAKEEAK